MKSLNKPLLVAFILGVAYLLYAVVYWGGAASEVSSSASSSAESAGAAIATVLVFPHLVCVFIAVIFNALGLFMKKAGFALTAGILYAVSIVLFIAYFMFVVIQMVLSFVGYSQLKQGRQNQVTS